MDSGLSERMDKTLQELLPKAAAAVATPKNYDPSTAIDLSSAHNAVIRDELQEFFKTTVEDRLTVDAFDLPDTIGGDVALRQALTSFLNSYFNPIHALTHEHIVLTAGASDALENLVYAVCNDGDSVIVPGPFWYYLDGFEGILKSRPGVNIIAAHPPTYQNHDNYLIPSLQAAYDFSADKSRIKAVIICNPHNPLSQCYPKKTLVECMEFCQERGLHLISDELYALASLKGTSNNGTPFVSALSLTEPLVPSGAVKVDPSRVHVIWSPSKLFGSSGFRVGCVISQSNPQLRQALSLLTYCHTNNIASLYLTSLLSWSQLPTLLALNSERLSESYRVLAEALQRWDVDFVPPTHGIFLFARLAKKAKTVEEEMSFFNRLAAHGIRVSPGRFYNGVDPELAQLGWARIRFSIPVNDMSAAVAHISSFLAKEL
ncbi:PLP-dependent transferase [Lindgomyces ingoldianus]|uniref:PLP-dependent transferase n=1 Tax=Lindgomyces ingoldianus TaxID=673940 RepID=A0ACB6QFL4_9PLEO|nr:PLP-dependent transferase [Lindgomyces ingoldianus]KAF2465686.1 PLP-dependent transferase [Lindgomyces ingoldianus]